MHDVQHISVSIPRRPAEVYEFASDPRNLPRWASGRARSESKQQSPDLKRAIEAVLRGRPVPKARTQAFGCAVDRF